MNSLPSTANRYISQNGFKDSPTIRGIHEIFYLFSILKKHNAFICGDYARYCLSPVKDPIPSIDIDIYSGNEDDFILLKNFFIKEKNLTIRHENRISVTFNRPDKGLAKYHPPIQIIKPLKKGNIVTSFSESDIKNVLKSFDFTVIRCALVDPGFGIVDADFEHDEKNKIIRIKNIHYPISSTLRATKYVKKGYYFPPTQVVKLMVDWENRDPEYRKKILEFIGKLEERQITQEELDELEMMLNVD